MSFSLFAPLSWWLLNSYLNRYQVRKAIAWWIFPLVGVLLLTFALLIVGKQAHKAALCNPVSSLRSVLYVGK